MSSTPRKEEEEEEEAPTETATVEQKSRKRRWNDGDVPEAIRKRVRYFDLPQIPHSYNEPHTDKRERNVYLLDQLFGEFNVEIVELATSMGPKSYDVGRVIAMIDSLKATKMIALDSVFLAEQSN